MYISKLENSWRTIHDLFEIIVFITLMITGYIIRFIIESLFKTQKLYNTIVKILVNTLYYFLIPTTLFVVFSNRGFLNIDLFIVIYFVLFMLSIYYISRRFFNNETCYAVFLLSTFPNSVFLGFPVSYILFGNIRIASIMGALTVALNVIVPDLLVSGKLSVKPLLSSLSIHGFLAGIILHYVSTRGFIEVLVRTVWWVTPLTTYLAVLTMGLRIPLKLTGIKQYVKPAVFASIARFVYAPLLSTLFVLPLGFNIEDVLQLLVISMMPPAVLNIVVAQRYNWDPQLVSVVIPLLTILFLSLVFPILYVVVNIYI